MQQVRNECGELDDDDVDDDHGVDDRKEAEV